MAANPWLRLYAEFATDPKVQMLSEADQRRFIMLLCLRCSNDGVTLQDDEIAFQLRISNEDWSATKDTLIAKNLIDDDAMPTAWNKRQFVSDSSAERVAAYRARKKRACNVTVTPPDTDTESDTDIKNPPLSPQGEPTPEETDQQEILPLTGTKPDKPKKPSSRKTRLPEDFALTVERRTRALSYWQGHGRPDLKPETEFHKFTNHHRANGKTMANWDAAWTTWYTNAVEFTKPNYGSAGGFHAAHQPVDTSAAGRVRANVARERAAEQQRFRPEQNSDFVGNDVVDVWPPLDQ
ncbi:phage replisome organizer N-terminal domain-containing protein [Salinispirillum sp. LH 10-3-1]|uniref:Phage replisome organizer N-terminal domain-containing protein n=1 Tax=Salinispirillum sp. LH 10-3-1 TaxID=2952525 RepID=A0AB38YCB1_9GAMM